jgi:formylglycine-generating enzyme required for sulfatase activity
LNLLISTLLSTALQTLPSSAAEALPVVEVDGQTVEKTQSQQIPGSKVEITWVSIPVGKEGYPTSIQIGSPASEKGRNEDEGPTWTVTVEPFSIMKFEVTWDAFDLFRQEYAILQDGRISGDRSSEQVWADAVSIPTPLWEQDSRPILDGLGTSGGYPVADVTQFAAMQFSKWLSKKTGQFLRLPTEAEWEYAARCGQQSAFSFGDDASQLDRYGWYFDNSEYEDPDAGYPGLGAGYRKVGTLAPNRWGVHDLYGNVSEWTLDAYSAEGYSEQGGKKLLFSAAVNWPTKIWPAVVRGGSWQDDPQRCRSASRAASTRKWQKRDPQIPKSLWWCTDAFHVGFRLVRPEKPPVASEQARWWDPRIDSIQRHLKEGYKELRTPIKKLEPDQDE